MTLADLPPWFTRAFAVAFGLIWGSFLNVVIYRVPRGMSVVSPPSHCPACGKPVRPWDNVPVLSYAILGGKARCCGAKLSPRYPLVEAIGGVLSLAILEVIVANLPEGTSIGRAFAVYAADLALALGLVATAFIDLEHMIVPDAITFGGAALGVATAPLRSMSFVDSLIGAVAGYVIVWLPLIVLYPRVRRPVAATLLYIAHAISPSRFPDTTPRDVKVAMGRGDATLLMLAGAWFGWAGALFVLGAGATQGLVFAIITLAIQGSIEEPDAVKAEREATRAELDELSPEERAELEKELAEDPLAEEPDGGILTARLAFGPFLALAMLELLLLGKERTGVATIEELTPIFFALFFEKLGVRR